MTQHSRLAVSTVPCRLNGIPAKALGQITTEFVARNMLPGSSKSTPTTPYPSGPLYADILHLIINLVAEFEPTTRVQLLRTFSIVSKKFHIQARKHLFSRICFQLCENTRKRDKRLLRFLKKPRNEYLHSDIRSVIVILGPFTPTLQSIRHGRSPSNISTLYKASLRSLTRKLPLQSLKSSSAFISSVLDFLTGLESLQSFSMSPHSPNTISWNDVVEAAPQCNRLLLVASKQTVRQLHFKLIWKLPKTFLLGGTDSPGLTHFSVYRTYFHRFEPAPPFSRLDLTVDEAWTIRNRLQSLKYLQWDCPAMHFNDLLSPEPIQFISNPPPSPTPCHLLHLTTAVMNISGQGLGGLNQTFRFLLSVSGTLQFLELVDLAFTYDLGLADLDSTYMDNFIALRHIGFKIRCNDIDSASGPLDLCSRLLLTARLPSSITRITVEIQDISHGLFMLLYNRRTNPCVPNHTFNALPWLRLDSALTNPSFIDLETINLSMKLYMGHNDEKILSQFTGTQPSLQHILPNTYRLSSATLKVSVESIVGKSAYERWAYQDKFDERFPGI